MEVQRYIINMGMEWWSAVEDDTQTLIWWEGETGELLIVILKLFWNEEFDKI